MKLNAILILSLDHSAHFFFHTVKSCAVLYRCFLSAEGAASSFFLSFDVIILTALLMRKCGVKGKNSRLDVSC